MALVLGAGVYPDGRLSSMLTDRVLTTVVLYQEGKVDKLLMSGDNSLATYNEPWRMADFAISQGVPEQDIAFDYAVHWLHPAVIGGDPIDIFSPSYQGRYQ